MVFTSTEIIFYTVVSIFGVVGGIIRHLRDGSTDNWVRNVGRCLSSWVVSFGIIGLWIGDDATGITSPFYFLAVSTLVGYVAPDIQEKIISRLIAEIQRRAGLPEEKAD